MPDNSNDTPAPTKRPRGRPPGSTSPRAAAASRANGAKNGQHAKAAAIHEPPASAAPTAEQLAAYKAATTFHQARAALTAAKAQRERSRIARESGNLIPREDLVRWLSALFAGLRRELDGMPRLIESLRLDHADAERMREIVKQFANKARAQLAGMPELMQPQEPESTDAR